MTKRLQDCTRCDGMTRHNKPAVCSVCRLTLRLRERSSLDAPVEFWKAIAEDRLDA